MELQTVAQRFILHWGEMGSRWGVNRTVSQIYALLFLAGRPMPADEIAETLNVARSNVSNSLKELQGWGLARGTHIMGDRRDHFETSTDIWELFRVVVRERKAREFDPTLRALKECVNHSAFAKENKDVQKRLADTLLLMEMLGNWSDEMLRLSPETLVKMMKFGGRVQKLVRIHSRADSKQKAA